MDVYGSLVLTMRPGACFEGGRSGLLSTSHAGLSARGPFPLLGASASRFVEAALYFLPPSGGELLSSSSSSSSVSEE